MNWKERAKECLEESQLIEAKVRKLKELVHDLRQISQLFELMPEFCPEEFNVRMPHIEACLVRIKAEVAQLLK